jgi:hypothetical protein
MCVIIDGRFKDEKAGVSIRTTSSTRSSDSEIGAHSGTVLERLNYLSQLPQDWDSYGASPVSPAALRVAHQALSTISRAFGEPTLLGARADGGIIAEWTRSNGSLEFHIEPDGEIGFLLEDTPTGEHAEADAVTLDTVLNRIASLSGQ